MVELLIVVAILAFFAALVIPKLTDQMGKARDAEAFATVDLIRSSERLYKAEHGVYFSPGPPGPPGIVSYFRTAEDWRQLGLEPPVSAARFSYAAGMEGPVFDQFRIIAVEFDNVDPNWIRRLLWLENRKCWQDLPDGSFEIPMGKRCPPL